MRILTGIKAGGDTVDNQEHWFHHQPATGLFEVRAKRHLGNQQIDAQTSTAGEGDWYAIVTSAKGNDTDTEFASVCASVWPQWTADHLVTPGLVAGYRAFVLKVVDPQP